MKLLLIIAALLTCAPVLAEIQKSDDKQSLRDLNGVFVISQLVDAKPDDLTTNRIEKMVASDLQQAGIHVYTEPKLLEGCANLSVNVDIIKDSQTGLYLFTAHVTVIQMAKLTRLPHAQPIAAQTWARDIQGFTTPDRMDAIEQAIKECVAAFVDDYWKVNPKPSLKK